MRPIELSMIPSFFHPVSTVADAPDVFGEYWKLAQRISAEPGWRASVRLDASRALALKLCLRTEQGPRFLVGKLCFERCAPLLELLPAGYPHHGRECFKPTAMDTRKLSATGLKDWALWALGCRQAALSLLR